MKTMSDSGLVVFFSRSTLQNYLKKHEQTDVSKASASSINPFDKGEIASGYFIILSKSTWIFLLEVNEIWCFYKLLACNQCWFLSNSVPAFTAVAQEFGVSQPGAAASGSQQPQQASSTIHILSLLLRLRQCCCHLSLLKKVCAHVFPFESA